MWEISEQERGVEKARSKRNRSYSRASAGCLVLDLEGWRHAKERQEGGHDGRREAG